MRAWLLAAALLFAGAPAAAEGEAPCSAEPIAICPTGPCEKPCCYALWVLGEKLVDPLFCTV